MALSSANTQCLDHWAVRDERSDETKQNYNNVSWKIKIFRRWNFTK